MADSRPSAKRAPSQTDYQRVVQLMKDLGSKEGFTPLPPDHHEWQRDPGEPPLYRMWSFMIHSTCYYGRRCAYAVNLEGDEIHLEHMARKLKMDVPNCRHYWKIGVNRGLWRNGTEEEGPRRMYLCGRVPKFKAGDNGKVCTYSFPRAIYNQIKDWPEEKQEQLRESLDKATELEKEFHAALIAAKRQIFIQRQNSILLEYGVKPVVQLHKKQIESEEDAAARRARTEPILAPLEEYVHTLEKYVHSRPKPVVQTFAETPPYIASEKDHRSTVPVGRALPDSRNGKAHHKDGKKPLKQHPAPKPEALNEQEQQAEKMLFEHIRKMQEAYPHLDFSKETVSWNSRNDHLLIQRIISTVGVDYVPQFLDKVRQQLVNLNKNAFGKLPGAAPGPRSLGLILFWAKQYAEALDEAARVQEAERRKWLERQIAACLEIINDPSETAEAKYGAQKFLEENSTSAA